MKPYLLPRKPDFPQSGKIYKKPGGWVLLFLCAFFFIAAPVKAEEIHIAAASNFNETLKTLAKQFEAQSGHKLILSFGSTGKQYAQIRHGAPFDAFFAADSQRPKLLEEQEISRPGSRFTYAIGRLVLWSPQAALIDAEPKNPNKTPDVLNSKQFRYLAIGNPKLAPYGKAARQILEKLKLWQSLQGQMVRGENIGQTYQYVKSGNAELGFIAYSQIKKPGCLIAGSWWLPPESLYTPIRQQAVLLSKKPGAAQFLQFVKSPEAQQIIQSHGYRIADAD